MEARSTDQVPLTEATANLIAKIEKDNAKSRWVGLMSLLLMALLVGIGVVGI